MTKLANCWLQSCCGAETRTCSTSMLLWGALPRVDSTEVNDFGTAWPTMTYVTTDLFFQFGLTIFAWVLKLCMYKSSTEIPFNLHHITTFLSLSFSKEDEHFRVSVSC